MTEKENILEIYKLHVEMIDRLSSRRSSMNQYYIGILSALIGLISMLNWIKISYWGGITNILIGSIGVIICFIWKINIQSYKQLSSAKFRVLDKIESKLEFQFYKDEWGLLKNSKKYKTFTSIEKIIPMLMVIRFLALLVIALISLIN